MSVLAKKLYIQKTGSSAVACNLYTTTAEVGSPYMGAVVGGTTCYIPLGTTSDANATVGRVYRTSDKTTYAIKKQAVVAYGKTIYTSGSFTFTTPSGVTKLRITLVGGGGGGAFIDEYYDDNRGGTGGTSYITVGSKYTATGGSGGYYTYDGSEYGNGATYTPGTGGSPSGHSGTRSNGGAGFSVNGKTYGTGGNGDPGGGSGGYRQITVSATAGTSYSGAVGAGGTGSTNGTAGCVFIEWGQGIE